MNESFFANLLKLEGKYEKTKDLKLNAINNQKNLSDIFNDLISNYAVFNKFKYIRFKSFSFSYVLKVMIESQIQLSFIF